MLIEKSLDELSDLLNRGAVSSREVARAFLERISAVDEKINAFITCDEDRLFREADESDRRRQSGNPRSPYDGIPVAVKDNICTEGLRTTCASGILRDFIPPYDATAYANMRSRGFITLGKTNMDEFAMGSTSENSYFGPVRNPHDRERVPGGSSGGSAAAVSALMAPVALGSDTGGSIRLPASFCGVVGIKPTYGRVSRYGLVAFASSLDQIGSIARTVDDAAILLDSVAGFDPRDSTSVNMPCDLLDITDTISGLRIGVPDEYFDKISPDMKEAIDRIIVYLEKNGAVIENISLKYTEYAIPVYYLIATAEASSNLARYDGVRYGYRSPNSKKLKMLYERTRSEGFGTEVKRRIILGTFSLSAGYYDAYYQKALKGRTLIINDFREAFSKVDALITPTAPTTAFKIGEKISDPLEMYMTDVLTISANLAALPGVSVPIALDGNGMPIGVQLLGNYFQEKTILTIAKNIEKNCGSFTPTIL